MDAEVMGNILVVEDEKEIRLGLAQFLEGEGYQVTTAENGEVGLRKLEEEKPSLVLLDLMMPVMNGWDFLEKKNQKKALAPIPVLVISAVRGNPHIPGALGFLKKPIDLDRLMDFVELYCPKAA